MSQKDPSSTVNEATQEKAPRGFAGMDRERHREIASLGGKTSHARGTAHEFTPEEAKSAGRLGGLKVSADREHMARIGRMGGNGLARVNRAGASR